MWQEWFKEFEKQINENQEAKQEEIKESARQLYKLKENFKMAGFTEKQLFELLKTLIILNGKG